MGGFGTPTGGTQGTSARAARADHTHPASGGLTQSYVGYNTAGANTETFNGYTIYMKQVTLATAGLMNSIDVYVKDSGAGGVGAISVALMEDSAGNPSKIIALGRIGFTDSLYLNSTARWIACSLGAYLSAGTYWLAVQAQDSSGGLIQLHYDAGSDKTMAPGGGWMSDGGNYTISTSARKYSIRASVLG